MIGKTIEEIKIGDKEYFEKTIAESDVYLFAGIIGDMNSFHINKKQAEKSFFKERVAHGMLTASFFSTVIGTKLPGPGSVYISQNISFLNPVKFGDTIRAEVEVLQLDKENNRVVLKTVCTNQKDKLVIDGEAVIMPPKKRDEG